MNNIAEIRREYSLAMLDIDNVLPDPVAQFQRWFNDAMTARVLEPNAMNLATVNKDGRPSARIVLLKGIEENRFIFFTNHQSDKGRELEQNPACALTFFWPELERQVRIEGISHRLDPIASEAYFKTRPRGSQIGAWASPQSTIIENRIILEERAKQIEKRFSSVDALPKPQQWGGYAVEAFLLEFWQGRPSRLHDRIEYLKVDNSWKIHRLAP